MFVSVLAHPTNVPVPGESREPTLYISSRVDVRAQPEGWCHAMTSPALAVVILSSVFKERRPSLTTLLSPHALEADVQRTTLKWHDPVAGVRSVRLTNISSPHRHVNSLGPEISDRPAGWPVRTGSR